MKSNLRDPLALSCDIPEDVRRECSRLAPRLGTFGRRVHWFTSTSSTNDVAAHLAELGADEGTVVVADAQTSGRGRMGRIWVSPAGAGLYVSVVLRPLASTALLTLAAGVAVAEGIQAGTGLQPEIKWPNDVMVGRRKLGGILAEAAAQGDRVDFVVLGFGLNVRPAAYPPDVAARATSIEGELNRSVDRARLLVEILAAIAARYADLQQRSFDAILSAWRERVPSLRGSLMEWDAQDGVQRGRAEDIDESGALVVRVDGGTRRVIAGEVRWA